MRKRPALGELKYFADRWTQTGETDELATSEVGLPSPGELCTPTRYSLRRSCSFTLLGVVGESDEDTLCAQRHRAATECFVEHMLPAVKAAFSQNDIRLVVELIKTDNIMEEVVRGESNIQFADSNSEDGAAVIINLCAPGPACLALVLSARGPDEIAKIWNRVTASVATALCILVIAHDTGKFPAHAIPSRLRSDNHPLKIETRHTDLDQWDVSVAFVTMVANSPRPFISKRPLVTIVSIPKRSDSCPMLSPLPPS
jgi:hypothetical protein